MLLISAIIIWLFFGIKIKLNSFSMRHFFGSWFILIYNVIGYVREAGGKRSIFFIFIYCKDSHIDPSSFKSISYLTSKKEFLRKQLLTDTLYIRRIKKFLFHPRIFLSHTHLHILRTRPFGTLITWTYADCIWRALKLTHTHTLTQLELY